jgi:hypothetical protein
MGPDGLGRDETFRELPLQDRDEEGRRPCHHDDQLSGVPDRVSRRHR